MENNFNSGAGDNIHNKSLDKTNLIVNYIPQFATEADLAILFSPIGRLESIRVMRDFKTGYSYGFGFVKYFNEEDAAKAIDVLNGITYRNKRLKVSYSRPPGTEMKDTNLYVTNLPKDVTLQQIDNMFRAYGEIVQKTLLNDKYTGMPRGVAFVRYAKQSEAQAAIADLDGKILENAMFPLSVRVAEDHGRQKAQYFGPWNAGFPNRGVPQIRPQIPVFREMNSPRGNMQNRPRMPLNVRNNGAGDTFYQTFHY